ncbi:MAG: GatB/YqeY domain-containing protein [Actinomycetota bacterium]
MSLKEKLQNDLTSSMRARDEIRSSTIRMILTSIKNEEVSGKEARDLSDAEVITVLSREAKKRREAAEAFDQAGAKDRADQERAEGEIIAEYLPAQLSESEIKELIRAAIAETGANSLAQMGLVMKSLQPKTAGKADGGLVSSLVKAALAGGN